MTVMGIWCSGIANNIWRGVITKYILFCYCSSDIEFRQRDIQGSDTEEFCNAVNNHLSCKVCKKTWHHQKGKINLPQNLFKVNYSRITMVALHESHNYEADLVLSTIEPSLIWQDNHSSTCLGTSAKYIIFSVLLGQIIDMWVNKGLKCSAKQL